MEEVLTDHPYAASHVLALGPLLGPDPRPALVAVPNQHHLVVVPRNEPDPEGSLDEIADLAKGLFDVGPHPISPEPFLWDGTRLVPLHR